MCVRASNPPSFPLVKKINRNPHGSPKFHRRTHLVSPLFFSRCLPKTSQKGPKKRVGHPTGGQEGRHQRPLALAMKIVFIYDVRALFAMWKYTYIFILICENLLPLSLVSRSRCSSICKNNLLNCPKYPKKEHAQTRGSFINGTSPENDQRTFITKIHRESITVYSWR